MEKFSALLALRAGHWWISLTNGQLCGNSIFTIVSRTHCLTNSWVDAMRLYEVTVINFINFVVRNELPTSRDPFIKMV